jgi:Na+/H+ antiporter NhaC
MSDEIKGQGPVPEEDLKEYAGGWMTERKGTDVPPFLKFAFPVIGLSCVAYLILYINGDVNQAERGTLVQQLNRATGFSPVLMYLIALLLLIYVIWVVIFAIRKFHED